MLQDSLFNRIFIRSSIYALRSITPACVCYCFIRLADSIATTPLLPARISKFLVPLDIYCISEAVFFVGVICYRQYLDRPPAPYTPFETAAERKQCLQQTFSATPNPQSYLSGWFFGARIDDIQAEDLKDFLLWRLWNQTSRGVASEDELSSYLSFTESVLQHRFTPGRSKTTAMAVTFEPMRVSHRPLFWYCMMVGGADLQFTFLMRLIYGFRFHSLSIPRMLSTIPWRPATLTTLNRSPTSHLSYWHIPHTSKACMPIFFFHGIGIGLHFYLDFFKEFLSARQVADGQIGMIAIEYMPVANRITHPVVSADTMCGEVYSILRKHEWERVVLMTHSYGSVTAAHLLKNSLTRQFMGPLVFVDPVCFSFHTPNVPYNFLRRKPTSASEIQLQYFASKDLGVAHALTRGFGFWGDNSLWREDIEPSRRQWKCCIALAGRDIITDTETLGRYLVRRTESGKEWYQETDEYRREEFEKWGKCKDQGWFEHDGLKVMWFEDCNHAEEFEGVGSIGPVRRKRLLETMITYSRDGSVEVDEGIVELRTVNGELRIE